MAFTCSCHKAERGAGNQFNESASSSSAIQPSSYPTSGRPLEMQHCRYRRSCSCNECNQTNAIRIWRRFRVGHSKHATSSFFFGSPDSGCPIPGENATSPSWGTDMMPWCKVRRLPPGSWHERRRNVDPRGWSEHLQAVPNGEEEPWKGIFQELSIKACSLFHQISLKP